MTQNCFSMRPGTIFGFKEQAWRVIGNDTFNEVFFARCLDPKNPERKTFRYPPSKEISIRWKPTNP